MGINKVVVITGSTRGIGFGMARSFLEQGCSVAISSSNKKNVIRVLRTLKSDFGDKVWGAVCAVEHHIDVQELWNMALAYFGHIDIWINNAGIKGNPCNCWEHHPDMIYDIINTNITGTLNGVNVAVSGMLKQGGGQIFNMCGTGSNGEKLKGNGLYGSTKYAIKFITDTLVNELRDQPVLAGSLSPGALNTNIAAKNIYRTAQKRKAEEQLPDKVEKVAPWLVQQVLNNNTNGASFSWARS